jgi:hypothetical protein
LSFFKKNLPYVTFLLIVLCLYIFCAPKTVQTGDTGELVTNSYFLRVSHPPGYPLWTLLYHFPVSLLKVSTPFHLASLFTIALSLISLCLLVFRFKNLETLAVLCILSSSNIFWKYSILPDVFALHTFFLVIVYLAFMEPRLLNKSWFIFLISLSVAHHHTIVFVFPLFVYALCFSNYKKNIIWGVFFGVISLSIYCLLLLFHPQDLSSWGDIQNLKDVLNHFLRKDYGTLSLHARGKSNNDWIIFFISNFLINFWSIIITLFYFVFFNRKTVVENRGRILVLFFCLLSYFATFFLSGVFPMDYFGESTFERFLIQPYLLVLFLTFLLINQNYQSLPKWIVLLLFINTGANLGQNFKINNFSQNTVVEDYVLNYSRVLPQNSVLYTGGDTLGFSYYYIRDVLGVRKDVHHLFNSLEFPFYLKKIKRVFPDIEVGEGKNFLFSFNFDKYTFFTNIQPPLLPKNTEVVFFGTLFKVQKAKEIQFVKKFECEISSLFKWRVRPELDNFQSYEGSLFFDLIYGNCFLSRGVDQLGRNDLGAALRSFEKARDLSPNSAIYLERLCEVYKKMGRADFSACDERLGEVITKLHFQYFLGFDF